MGSSTTLCYHLPRINRSGTASKREGAGIISRDEWEINRREIAYEKCSHVSSRLLVRGLPHIVRALRMWIEGGWKWKKLSLWGVLCKLDECRDRGYPNPKFSCGQGLLWQHINDLRKCTNAVHAFFIVSRSIRWSRRCLFVIRLPVDFSTCHTCDRPSLQKLIFGIWWDNVSKLFLKRINFIFVSRR